MKIIDGENAILGRVASFAAKSALKGEEVTIVNCNKILVTGSKKNIKENWRKKREMIGSTQKGPKHSRLCEKLVKRSIRGMLSTHRKGKGKNALQRIKCYSKVPESLKNAKKIEMPCSKNKFMQVGEISK